MPSLLSITSQFFLPDRGHPAHLSAAVAAVPTDSARCRWWRSWWRDSLPARRSWAGSGRPRAAGLFPPPDLGAETFHHPNLTAIYVLGQARSGALMFLVGRRSSSTSRRPRPAGRCHRRRRIGIRFHSSAILGWWMVSPGGYFTGNVDALAGRPFRCRGRGITASRCWRGIALATPVLLNTRLGTMALCPAPPSTTACSWVLLATVVATAKRALGGRVPHSHRGRTGLTCCSMVYIGRPLLARLATGRRRAPMSNARAAADRIPASFCSRRADRQLVHRSGRNLFGVRRFSGAVVPRVRCWTRSASGFEPLVAYLLLPAFFICSGLNTQLMISRRLSPSWHRAHRLFAAVRRHPGLLRWQGMSWWKPMGALANARGLMELILLNIGLRRV